MMTLHVGTVTRSNGDGAQLACTGPSGKAGVAH
jgi:hypothetical protein